jgi:hypothetical protein
MIQDVVRTCHEIEVLRYEARDHSDQTPREINGIVSLMHVERRQAN